MTRAHLALGSNLGDRGATLRAACTTLTDRGVRVLARSPIAETDPVGGPPGQGRYLNQVITVLTDLDAHGLLALCQQVEVSLGRRRRARWGPRTIDIDILTFGDERVDDPTLRIPHPRRLNRPFVMVGTRALTR